jgi:NAD(P)-dependent dehydrogenase (short-subunit alcohol dehydrogenase family)
MGGYGLSKAGLTAYTIVASVANPGLKITSLSPGFIETKMTSGFGAKLTPEQVSPKSLPLGARDRPATLVSPHVHLPACSPDFNTCSP